MLAVANVGLRTPAVLLRYAQGAFGLSDLRRRFRPGRVGPGRGLLEAAFAHDDRDYVRDSAQLMLSRLASIRTVPRTTCVDRLTGERADAYSVDRFVRDEGVPRGLRRDDAAAMRRGKQRMADSVSSRRIDFADCPIDDRQTRCRWVETYRLPDGDRANLVLAKIRIDLRSAIVDHAQQQMARVDPASGRQIRGQVAYLSVVRRAQRSARPARQLRRLRRRALRPTAAR